MTIKNVRFFKKAIIILSTGILFGGLSCVTTGDLTGTGQNNPAAGETGVIAPSLDLVKDAPIGG